MAALGSLGLLVWLIAGLWTAGVGAQERNLTLREAISLAIAHNPALAVERHGINLAGGEVTKAQTYPHNPELELSPGLGATVTRQIPVWNLPTTPRLVYRRPLNSRASEPFDCGGPRQWLIRRLGP